MEQDRTPLIRFEKCDIKGGEQTVIYDLRMVVEKGDFVYITGRVGSGKTSIIRTITAENEVCGGVAQVCGFDLVRLRRRDIPRLRRHLGVIFQDFRLLSELSVEDNLEFVLKATGWKNAREREARIGEVLRSVGMQDKSHRMPHQLSGGEQQRVSIARALLNSPDIILADEPTGHLDRETADSIMELFTRINREQGTAVVMVTHDSSLLERFPGKIFVCENESCLPR
mgnify:CR=1 FL=1